jgi:hypothetical protein
LYNWFAIFGTGTRNNGGRNLGGIVNTQQRPRPTDPIYTDQRNDWRVPSDADWNNLIGYIDPSYDPNANATTPTSATGGDKLKTRCSAPIEVGSGTWDNNSSATNQYNFSVVGGGQRWGKGSGLFNSLNDLTGFWSTTEWPSNANEAIVGKLVWTRDFLGAFSHIDRLGADKLAGLYIRLVRPVTSAEQSLPDGATCNTHPLLPRYIGNNRSYITVKIGNQVWTAQNLIDSNFNDGTTIPVVTNDATWGNVGISNYVENTGRVCSYGNSTTITEDGNTIALCGTPIITPVAGCNCYSITNNFNNFGLNPNPSRDISVTYSNTEQFCGDASSTYPKTLTITLTGTFVQGDVITINTGELGVDFFCIPFCTNKTITYTVPAGATIASILSGLQTAFNNQSLPISGEIGSSSTISGNQLTIVRGYTDNAGDIVRYAWCNFGQSFVTPPPSSFNYLNCSNASVNGTVASGQTVYVCANNTPVSPDNYVQIMVSLEPGCPSC